MFGGNLSLFSNFVSGKYTVDLNDKILFIEDLGFESPPRHDK
ncbi:MAG: LD-carboxypeptidase [Clostridia bacterium]|nr:LD-carboxypeptidase [Clostridia bacterium]